MMRRRPFLRAVLRSAALLTLLLAPASLEAQRGRTAVVIGASDLQGMNALTATEAYTQEVINNVLFVPLVRYDAQLRLEPALARSWRFEGDTAVVITLRDDVYWHDGVPTTARDVEFTFRRAQDPETGFASASELESWLDVQSLDARTLRFRLKPHEEPLAVWTQLAIMPAHRLGDVAPAELRNAAFNRAPVGNGPFRFVEYRANDRWVFEANPRHPQALGGPPRLARLVWRVVPENAAQITELLTGQAHMILAPRIEQVQEIGRQPGFRGVLKPSRRYYFIDWNGKDPQLADARVRRALMHALDRAQMIQVLRKGFAQVATAPIAPYHWAYDRSLEPLAYDTARARRLLAEAGYRDRDGDGVLEGANGQRFEIELKVAANSAFNRDLGEMIRSDLSKIGVVVKPRPTDFATMVEDISDPARRFQAAVLAFETDFRLNLRDSFHSEAIDGPYQSASYRNPRVDALLDEIDRATDRRQALPHWRELQRILRDEQPWGVLWYPPELVLMRATLRNADPDIRGIFRNVTEWSLARG